MPKLTLLLRCTIIALLLSGCFSKLKHATVENDPDAGITGETKQGQEFSGALAEEEEMLKDVSIGKIPDGIRELELNQAKEILDHQLSSSTSMSKLNSTSYTFQGPSNFGGRTRAIAVDLSDATGNTIIAGSVSGGVFKTIDGGNTWTRVNPTTQVFTITSIAQDPRAGFQNIWYYGGGEPTGNSASESGAPYGGDGIYKSIDNGNTWTRMANSNTGSLFSFDNRADFINRIVVNPMNGDVYAGCVGQIMRSQDGGATWNAVQTSLSFANSNQFTDVAITSTGIVYTAFSGTTNNGGSGATTVDGVWNSANGNAGSFTRIAGTTSATTPATWNAFGGYGRVVIAFAPSSENLVYVLYYKNVTSSCAGTATPEAEFFKWDNTLGSWADLSATLPDEPGCLDGNDPFAVQGGYDLVVSVKPNNSNTLMIGGTNAYRSTDGGATWTRIAGYASPADYSLYANHHSDIHALVFSPFNNNILYSGDDGGIQRGDISAATVVWTSLNNDYRTYQYYHVAIKQESGSTIFIGGAQDNGTTLSTGSPAMAKLYSGDGVAVALGSGSGTYKQYFGTQNGAIARRASTNPANTFEADLSPGIGSLFVTYFYLDPDNTDNLYYGGTTKLLRMTNASTAVNNSSWQTFSFVYPGTIRVVATTRGSYSATSRLYVGVSNGRLYRITDPVNAVLTTTPTDISPSDGVTFMGGSGNTLIGISVNPQNQDEVLAVYSNYGTKNIWYTNNAGSATPTWTVVEGNLTLPSVRACMIVKNGSTTEYYVGTSIGLYKSSLMNGSSTVWTQEAVSEIGNSLITSLSLRPVDNTFVIGTHGSGMWSASVSAPLPVHYTEFAGSLVNNLSFLKWVTADEENNRGFEIERSYDGVSYKKIGYVAGAGNSNSLRQYSFVDKEIAQDENYYRLKQIDLTGAVTYSSIVLIKNKLAAQSEIKILQNPFFSYLDIQLPKREAKQLIVRMIDMSGKIIYNQTINSDLTRQRLDFQGIYLSKGAYLLQVTDGSKQYSTKVMKE